MMKQGILVLSISTLLLTGCGGGGSSDNKSDDDGASPTPTQSINVNGKYNVIVTPSSSAGSECGGAIGSYTVTKNTDINGFVTDSHGTVFTVTGERETNGDVTGGFAFSNGRKSADFSGHIDKNKSSGTWSDIYGCSGKWIGTKTP